MHSATTKNVQDWRDLAPLEGWAKVASVYDGDTIWIITNISDPDNLDCPLSQLRKINIRLARIDTPEMKGVTPDVKAKAVAARDHVRDLILNKLVYFKLGNFGIGGESLDSFKRQIGEIYFDQPTEISENKYILGGRSLINLSDHLLLGGYAIQFKKK
jgi:endonuclease YncB( thermonuclease family)